MISKHLVSAGVALLACAAPAVAGVLPFDGAFGNDRGCALYSDGKVPDGQGEFFLITSNTFASYPVQCDFTSVAPGDGGQLLAKTICRTADGAVAKDSMILIDHGADGYGVKVGDLAEFGPYGACPPKKPGVPTVMVSK